MMCRLAIVARCLAGGVVLLAGVSQCLAQAAEPVDPAEWQALVAKKAALVAQLQEMSTKIQSAEPAEQQQIIKQAQELQQTFQKELSPRMVALAPAVFAANPKDVDAAEIMLQINYSEMKYADAAKVADVVLAQNPKHELALNIGGVSNFAIHEFEKSVQQLEAAKAADALYPQLGGQYLESAQNYIAYWAKEQQVRQQEAAATGDQQLPLVKMTTDKGEIVLELFENEAPNTVANFISLVEGGFYDGIKFHRVLPNFMAQGGDPNTKPGAVGQPGSGGPGYVIKCEAYEPGARRHFGGSLSMAHAGKDTGGSQFFITHLPTPHLDQEIAPQSVHTVFGRVADGMDTVWALRPDDVIQKVEVVRKRNHEYKPATLPDVR